jgi:hypothetical protein
VPLETARTRLKRGLQHLQRDLDRRHRGDRSAWVGALLPIIHGGHIGWGSSTTGVLIAMSTKAKMTVLVAALLAAVFVPVLLVLPSSERIDSPVPAGERASAASTGAERAMAAAPESGRSAEAPRLAAGSGSVRKLDTAPAHEGTFQFHYQQGYSFRVRAIVPPEEADLVFENCAGGISSVTFAAPGGAIVSLKALQQELPDLEFPAALLDVLVRDIPADTHFGPTAEGVLGSAHSDVFVLRTRRGEWVKFAILDRGTEGGWTELPVTVAYVLRPAGPVFQEGRGDLVHAGFEIDTAQLAERSRQAAEAASRQAEDAARKRAARMAPIVNRCAELDRRASALEKEIRAREGDDTHVAAVLGVGPSGAFRAEDVYLVSAYSFEKATRDDRKATLNDWDFMLETWRDKLWLRVRTVTDDRSVVRDLGPIDFATARRGAVPLGTGEERAEVVEGHVYVIHTLDTETDSWALLRVLELGEDASMVFQWSVLADPGGLRPALYPEAREMRAPFARLQIRGGAGGGNPNRVFLDGTKNAYVDEFSSEPLDLVAPIKVDERTRAFAEGGRVPAGKVFVVESIEYAARADGDSNGHGEFLLSVGPFCIAHVEEDGRAEDVKRYRFWTIERGVQTITREEFPIRGRLAVQIPIRQDEESLVFVEIANSSLADVVLRGRFVPVGNAPGRPAGSLDPQEFPTAQRRLRELADVQDPGLAAEAFDRMGLEVRPWLEAVLSLAEPGEYRRRIETAISRLR